MKLTKCQQKLVADAAEAGFIIKYFDTSVLIAKVRKNKITNGITLWEDGTATRADVDLTIATSIRTIKKMREILEI